MTLALERRKRFDPSFLEQFRTDKQLINGLTPELLADLFDLVSRFGHIHEEQNALYLVMTEPVGMMVKLEYIMPRPFVMMVIGDPANMDEIPGWVPEFPGGSLQWDLRLSASMAEMFIEKFDEMTARRGLIDYTTGERKVPLHPRFGVDKIFTEPGAIFHMLPGEQDAETIRQEFDHPEHVAIVPCGPGASLMCLIGERDWTMELVPFVESVYLEHGITTQADFKRTDKELEALQDDVRRVLKKPAAQ